MFWRVLGQQVVQQAGVFQPQSCHIYIVTVFLQGHIRWKYCHMEANTDVRK